VTTGARPRPRAGWVGVKNWEQKLASSEQMIHVNRHALDLDDSHEVKLVFKLHFGRKEAGPKLAS